MRNEAEDKSGSSGELSARNSMLDPHDDIDLDDAFGLSEDRLVASFPFLSSQRFGLIWCFLTKSSVKPRGRLEGMPHYI